MPMVPFCRRFEELAFAEMRSLTFRGEPSLPDGTYGFLEFYCNETECDCRRVILHVVRADTGMMAWAAINFGWEKPEFYERWSPRDPEARAMARPFLDPLNPQSPYSRALLAVFSEMIAADPAYVERLRRHYEMFKEALTRTKAGGGRRARTQRRGAARSHDRFVQ